MSKHGWTYKKLGEIATFINGDRGRNYPSQNDFVEDGIPFINAGHLGKGFINFDSMNYIDEEKYEKLNSGKIIEGDILFCLRGSLGKRAIIKGIERGAIASSLVIIRSINVSNKYLYYFLGSPTIARYIQRDNNGSSQPNLSAKSVSNFILPIPSLEVQSRIANELDEINEAIAALQQQVADLDTLAQATFHDMFGDPVTNPKGWEIKKLGEIAHYSSKRVSAASLNPSNYVGVDNLLKDKQGKTDASFFPTDGNVTAYSIGDTLLGNIRPYLKKIWYADSNGGASGDVLVIQVNDEMKSKVHPFFIFYTLSLDAFFDFDMLHSKGAKMPRGSKPEIMKFPICNPPLALQQEFAAKVEAIESAKAELNSQIAEMQTLLASRMDYYFD